MSDNEYFIWDNEDEEYDSVAHKISGMLLKPDERVDEWKDIEWLPGEDGSTILDVACGNGNYYPFFTKFMGFDYTGCDLSENMLEICRENYPDGEFVHADATDLPFEDGEFDIVFCSGLLLHVPVEVQEDVLDELYRIASKYVVVQTRPVHEGNERIERVDNDGALFRHEPIEEDLGIMMEFDEDVEWHVLRERDSDRDVYWVMEVEDEADSAENRSSTVYGKEHDAEADKQRE